MRETELPLITPGEYLREEFLEPLGITMNALSLSLRVSQSHTFGSVKHGRAISAEMALRLGQYFGMQAEFWMNLQANYELKKAKREKLVQIQAEVQRRSSSIKRSQLNAQR